jgi:hypothetical protein
MMRNKLAFLLLMLLWLGIGSSFAVQEKARVVEINGIRHIQNPAIPAKGTVLLDIEKVLEVNPFDNPDVALRFIFSARLDDGAVILYDINDSKAYLFSPNGKYERDLVRNGQGPGEFSPRSTLLVHPMKNQIWISGGRKLAKFDHNGRFLGELKTGDQFLQFVDENRYVTDMEMPSPDLTIHKKILLKKIDAQNRIVEGPIFKEGTYIRGISNPNGPGGFYDAWCIPNIEYAVDPKMRRVYVVEKVDYKIEAKDLEGKTLFVIERPFKRCKVSRKDVESAKSHLAKDERSRWIIDAYPRELMAIQEMKPLPNGYLAVYRITGIGKYEIDVFDSEGIFQYIIKLPAGMRLYSEQFYDFGFGNIEGKGDFPAYVQYRVKNLPDMFRKEKTAG